MGMLDGFRNIWQTISWMMTNDPGDNRWRERMEHLQLLRQYRLGQHRKQLKVKARQADDNLTINLIGLVVDRAVSLLVGKGLEFDLPGDPEEEEQQYLDRVWDLNKQGILLHKLAQHGATLGTGYAKILVDDIRDPDNPEAVFPRIVPIDPLWVEIVTDSEDMDRVHQYVIRFNTTGPDGKPMARKQVIERELGVIEGADENGNPIMLPTAEVVAWTISDFEASEATGWKWRLMFEPEVWEYPFPPIIHWQNLPNPDSVYGRSDIEDLVNLQDRINFVSSNISKIIRYHAHPKTWGRGGSLGERASWGPDEIVMMEGESARIENLEMQSELASSTRFLEILRQIMFDTSRTVDISSMADKLGQLTNFGLRVLYQDALSKLETKRQLYGDALLEINRRLLVLQKFKVSDPGEIVWPEPLPVDKREQSEVVARDLELGLVSKQTAAKKRGYDWEEERERIEAEAALSDNVGAALLRAFEQGG